MHMIEELNKKITEMLNKEKDEEIANKTKPGEKPMSKADDPEDMSTQKMKSLKDKAMKDAGGKKDYSKNIVDLAMNKIK